MLDREDGPEGSARTCDPMRSRLDRETGLGSLRPQVLAEPSGKTLAQRRRPPSCPSTRSLAPDPELGSRPCLGGAARNSTRGACGAGCLEGEGGPGGALRPETLMPEPDLDVNIDDAVGRDLFLAAGGGHHPQAREGPARLAIGAPRREVHRPKMAESGGLQPQTREGPNPLPTGAGAAVRFALQMWRVAEDTIPRPLQVRSAFEAVPARLSGSLPVM